MDEKEPKLKDLRKPTHKQKLFIREYLKDLNATQAALRAGYSKKTACFIGPQLLKKTHIALRIKKIMDKRSEKVEFDADLVLRSLRDIITFNPQELYQRDGQMKHLLDMPEHVAKHLSAYKVLDIKTTKNKDGSQETAITKEIKWYDKLKAIELGMKHLGLLTEKIDIYNGGDSNLSHDERAKLARARMIEELEGKAVGNEKDANESDIGDDKGHDTDAE